MIKFPHNVERTSPKGGPFIGICQNCGREDITIEQAMSTECPNLIHTTQGQAVIAAILKNQT